MHIRGLGIRGKAVGNDEIDRLFNEWDDDGSGGIDLHELEEGLRDLQKHWEATEGKRSALRLKKQAQLDQLNKRSKAAKAAVAAHELVEKAEEELKELEAHIASRLDI